MPSITYWSRLEPRPRARSIADSLAARVRDPLWMLARQWQLGEFRGEDAGSPAYAQIAARFGGLRSWSVEPGDPQPLPAGLPLEAAALAEDFSDTDLSLAVELGQVFEEALAELGRDDLKAAFRGAYRLDEAQAEARDAVARRFLQVAAGRCLHGLALYRAAEVAAPGLPTDPEIPPGDEADVQVALERLRTWVRDTLGPLGGSDAPSWDPERLEYDLAVAGQSPDGGELSFTAHPDSNGAIEWYTLDAREPASDAEAPAERPARVQRSVIPANASFRGMPNARWWAFEEGTLSLAAIQPEKREIAKLVVLDFMLVHSNDWYVIPFRQPLGAVCRIESLVVHDVFGGMTLVKRADGAPAPTAGRWTMFSTSRAGTGGVADLFLLPPAAGTSTQSGNALEEVRFVRDEMANMAWGIERVVENRTGEPWPAHERSALASGPEPRLHPDSGTPLHYQLRTAVPEHWIPFLPVVLDPVQRQVQLERGVVLQPEEKPSPAPAGRILLPTRLGEGYRLDEGEVSRLGVKVVRAVYRSRWTDGSTHLWIARRATSGTGEERSGLLYDLAVPHGSAE